MQQAEACKHGCGDNGGGNYEEDDDGGDSLKDTVKKLLSYFLGLYFLYIN